MSTRYFDLDIAVAPFIIAPVAQLNSEASVIIGPSEIAANNVSLTNTILGPFAKYSVHSPLLSQIQRYGNMVIATTTIRTLVPDRLSKRLGLKLTIGLHISPEAFLYFPDVTSWGMKLIDQYLTERFGESLIYNGAQEMVRRLQEDEKSLDEQFPDCSVLLSWFESSFCPGALMKATLRSRFKFARRYWRLLRKPRMLPSLSMENSLDYWEYIDQCLHLSAARPIGRSVPGEILR